MIVATTPTTTEGAPPLARLTNSLCSCVSVDQSEWDRCRALKEGVLGWSELPHYLVFKKLLKALRRPVPIRILVCGVYHGLDLRYLAGIAADLGQPVTLVGVDLFSDAPAADWPEHCKGKTWQEAMRCPPPDMEAAKRNCPTATLVTQDSVIFMEACAPDSFDVIWLDTAHDRDTVEREIRAALPILATGGFIGGDDYNWEVATAGVRQAVCSLLPQHILLFNRVWVASPIRKDDPDDDEEAEELGAFPTK